VRVCGCCGVRPAQSDSAVLAIRTFWIVLSAKLAPKKQKQIVEFSPSHIIVGDGFPSIER
jgi:hypothetical protein